MKELQRKIDTKVGVWYLVANEKGLISVLRNRQNISGPKANDADQADKKIENILDQAEKELSQYFSGQRKTFSVPLDIKGTEFQKKVWNELSQIPYGTTCSYKEIATKLKKPSASRAVGNANGKNPVSIIIPCHRVIAADGSMGGYSGGLGTKEKLLKLENTAQSQ